VIVVDSSVWISRLRDTRTDAVIRLENIENPSEILVGDAILLEVLQGARSEAQAAIIERSLRRFRIVAMMNPRLAVRAAANYRLLRERGFTIRGPLDMIIGTFCIEYDHVLLHQDRDFDIMEEHLGLRVL
jgi:predicted nucleic acid-binding protein